MVNSEATVAESKRESVQKLDLTVRAAVPQATSAMTTALVVAVLAKSIRATLSSLIESTAHGPTDQHGSPMKPIKTEALSKPKPPSLGSQSKTLNRKPGPTTVTSRSLVQSSVTLLQELNGPFTLQISPLRPLLSIFQEVMLGSDKKIFMLDRLSLTPISRILNSTIAPCKQTRTIKAQRDTFTHKHQRTSAT